jgi:hypothetical protein
MTAYGKEGEAGCFIYTSLFTLLHCNLSPECSGLGFHLASPDGNAQATCSEESKKSRGTLHHDRRMTLAPYHIHGSYTYHRSVHSMQHARVSVKSTVQD